MASSRNLTIVLIALLTVLSVHALGTWSGSVRADLTGGDLYSLTSGTRALLERMQTEGVQPLSITLYFSETAGKTLPKFIKDFITYERYLEELLREYQRESGGKIEVAVIDPIPDSDEAQDALDLGLDGKPINQHGDLFFFGLVLQTRTGSRDVIEFLWPDQQESIEYEISKRIYSLLWPSSKRIGVLSSLEVMGTADNPYLAQMLAAQGKTPQQKWLAIKLLEDLYQVEALDPDVGEISPDDYDLVIVIHPKGLPEKTLWALDRWVVTGGNLLVFLDPYAIDDQPPRNPQQPWAAVQYKPSSNLPRLLEAWGLSRPEDRIAADLDLAVRRRVSRMGGAESVVVDLAISGETREQTLATSHPILQGLSDLRLFMAGELVRDGAGGADGGEGGDGAAAAGAGAPALTFTPLITTTASGTTLEIRPGFGDGDSLVFSDVNQPAKLRDRYAPGHQPVVLAYLVQGRFPSAFPEGASFPAEEPERPPGLPPGMELPTPEGADMVEHGPVLEAERGDAAVAVFADVDMISDQVAFQSNLLGLVQAANDNYRVLLNTVDYLLGSRELMAIRAERAVRRPFTLFDEIEAAAEKETLERERQLRADVETFQKELQEKQGELSGAGAALFQKRLQDEVERINEKIQERNRELFEIRKARRAALEKEEARVRRSVVGWMPSLVLVVGLALAVRRRLEARRSAR